MKLAILPLLLLASIHAVAQDSVHAHRWVKPAVAVAYAASVYGCYRFLDTPIQDESQEGKGDVKTFIARSVTRVGLGKFQGIAWGATALTSFIIKNKKLQQTALIWLGALAINSTITNQLKISFQRHRPNSGAAYNVFDWRSGPRVHTSFPSAHTSNAFTMATVFATEYKDKKWVPVAAYGLATLVGLSRIYDNAHWASDVMAGAAIGFLSAKAMVRLYRVAGKKIRILPQASTNSVGLDLVWNMRKQ